MPRVADLAADFWDGRRSPLDFLERMLGRVDANAACHAFITVTRHTAQEQARKASLASSRPGPLYCIPYACKDLFFTRGIATTAGSPPLERGIPHPTGPPHAPLLRAGPA